MTPLKLVYLDDVVVFPGMRRRLLAGSERRAETGAARNARRRRAAETCPAVSAGPAGRVARPEAHPRRRGDGRAEAAARVFSAPADGRDSQGARRERGL